MERTPRRMVTKWLTVLLFALLIASFALWGVGDVFRNTGSSGPVIKAGETTVGPQEFARSFRRQFNQLRRSFGGNLDMETAKQMGLIDRIVQQITTRALFDAQAQAMGLLVSDKQLVERITQQPAFQNEQGQFLRARFETALQRARISEDEYAELLRTDIHRQQLVRAATGGLKAPTTMAEALFKHRNERRIADYAVVRDEAFAAPAPKETDLRAYYDGHDSSFMAPAYREVSLIHITTEQFLDEIKVSEAELRAAYENRRNAFHTPEKRRLKQIVFDERAAARKAVVALRDGTELASFAEKIPAIRVVDLGLNTQDEVLPEMAEPVFSVGEGAITDPIETSLGWHVVHINEVVPESTESFEAVRPDLRQDLAHDQAVETLVSLANKLDSELASGARLEEAARVLGLDIRRIPALDKKGHNRAGEEIANLPEKQKFLETAFNTKQGETSLLKETGSGGYFVLRVDSVTPPQKRPFASVKDRVAREWRQAQRREAAREAAESIQDSLNKGESFEQAAKLVGVEVQTSAPLKRTPGRDAAAAVRALADALFSIKEGGGLTAEIGEGVIVGQLKQIKTPDPAENEAQLAQIRQQTQQALQQDVLQQFSQALRKDHSLRVNQQQLDSIINRVN